MNKVSKELQVIEDTAKLKRIEKAMKSIPTLQRSDKFDRYYIELLSAIEQQEPTDNEYDIRVDLAIYKERWSESYSVDPKEFLKYAKLDGQKNVKVVNLPDSLITRLERSDTIEVNYMELEEIDWIRVRSYGENS